MPHSLSCCLIASPLSMQISLPRLQIIAALTEATGSDRWPDDEAFRSEWCRKKFYGNLRRNRVLMILRAIEEQYQQQATKSEPVLLFNFDELEIEHIMPQKWERHWPLSAVENARGDREHALHGIGNLTLVSGKLNPTLSNAAWLDNEKGTRGKWSALDEHAKLQLNNRLVKNYPKSWDEITIRKRAVELFEAACSIWPDPTILAGKQ